MSIPRESGAPCVVTIVEVVFGERLKYAQHVASDGDDALTETDLLVTNFDAAAVGGVVPVVKALTGPWPKSVRRLVVCHDGFTPQNVCSVLRSVPTVLEHTTVVVSNDRAGELRDFRTALAAMPVVLVPDTVAWAHPGSPLRTSKDRDVAAPPNTSPTANRDPSPQTPPPAPGASDPRPAKIPDSPPTTSFGMETLTSELEDLMSAMPESAEAAIRRALVLIDFNGLLVFRDKLREVGGRTNRRPDFTQGTGGNRHPFFVRPGAIEFVAQLANDPRCEIALYTSMKRHNMSEFLREFDNYQRTHNGGGLEVPVTSNGTVITTSSSLCKALLDIYDRPFNAPDPSGAGQWDTKRDLQLVFKSLRCQPGATHVYSADNTILIEGTWRKARDWLPNTLMPTEYGARDVVSAQQDTTLPRLGECLQCVLGHMQEDGATVPGTLSRSAVRAFNFSPV